jgi:hypothetical protein
MMFNNSTNINEAIVHDVDIGGIVDHHCLEANVHVVDIGEIVYHHWLEAIVPVVDIEHEQLPLKGDGQQFHQ